jgi:sugar phosphate isomerase/epimerase
MRRRDFLFCPAVAAVAVRRGRAQEASKAAKLKRVGAMSGNFDRKLAATRDLSQPTKPGELDIMDVPQMLADRFGLHNIDLSQYHLLSLEPAYLKKFRGRVRQAHSRLINMCLELDPKGYSGTVSVCSSDPQIRAKAVEDTRKWIDIAAMIECPSVMPNQGTFGEDLGPVIEALRTLAAYGKSKKVAVILEPRGRSTVDTLVHVIKEAGINANPDIGNFPDEETAERGLRMLYPLSKTVSHVKFNPNRHLDFAKAIQISKEMDFQGTYDLEASEATMQAVLDKLLENL